MGHVLVLGAGRSGLAAAAHLASRQVVLADKNPAPGAGLVQAALDLGVPAVWGPHPLALLDDCDEIVISPGIPLRIPLVQAALDRGIPVIGELELAHRALRARGDGSLVLAITGTNGKSTTTDLTAHLLRAAGLPAAACGNLGTPLLDALAGAAPGTRFAVECSSYQLETVQAFHADAAAVLNLTPDHLARHGTMEAYRAAKLRIFERQGPPDLAITRLDDPALAQDAPGDATGARFGWREPAGPGAWCDGILRLKDADDRITDLVHRDELLIPGDHNVENALVASLLARHGGAEPEGIRAGLRSYPGLAHRLVMCGQKDGVKAYNDSKGTNVDATLTAVRALPGPLVLLLGGEDKGTPYLPLREALEGKLRHLVFLGDAIPQLERDLGDLPHTSLWTFDEAVAAALAAARPGDQVLLSPACASFDQFRNFEHRGEHFEALVRAWAGA